MKKESNYKPADNMADNELISAESANNGFNVISYPVLIGRNGFNVKRECHKLYGDISLSAIDAFIHLIKVFDTNQRQEIAEYYYKQYRVDLNRYIEKNFKGVFKRMLLYGMQNEMERKEYLLRISIKKMNDINIITQILCILDNNGIQKVVELYDNNGIFRKSLKSQIIKLTADNLKLRRFLMNILDEKREEIEQKELIENDVSFLIDILAKNKLDNKDEIHLIDIFSMSSFQYLHDISVSFESLTNMTLIDQINNSLDIQNGIGFAINHILTFLMDKNIFYGDLLTKSMKNGGHKHILFWRVIIDRMNIDLNEILAAYNNYDQFKHFIDKTLYLEDASAANLILKLCRI